MVNQKIDPLESSVFQIVWARDQAFQTLDCDRDLVAKILLPVAMKLSRAEFAKAEQFLEVYARHLAAVQGVSEALAQHPWAWVRRPLDFAGAERLLDSVSRLSQVIRSAMEYCERLETVASLHLGGTLRALEASEEIFAALPIAEDSLHLHLLQPCQDAQVRLSLESFIGKIEQTNQARQALAEATLDHGTTLLAVEDDGPLHRANETLKDLGAQDRPLKELRERLEKCLTAESELGDSQRLFEEVVNSLGCEAIYTQHCLYLALQTMQIIESAPLDLLHLRRPGFELDGASHLARAASDASATLQREHAELEGEFDVTLAIADGRSDHLMNHARNIEEAGLWQRMFGKEYRVAKNAYRSLSVSPKKRARHQMSKNLRRLAEHVEHRRQFDSNVSYREAFGDEFRGVGSKWQELTAVADWYGVVFERLPDHRGEADAFRRMLFDSRLDRLKSLKAALAGMGAPRAALTKAHDTLSAQLESLPSAVPRSGSPAIKEFISVLHDFNERLSAALAVIDVGKLRQDLSPVEVDECLTSLRVFNESRNIVESDSNSHEQLKHSYKGLETNVEQVRTTLRFAEAIDSKGLSEGAIKWLLGEDCVARLSDLRGWLGNVKELVDKAGPLVSEIGEMSGGSAWASAFEEPIDRVLKRTTDSLYHRDDLPPWSHFVRAQDQSKGASLERLTSVADAKQIEPHHLVPAFRYCFYNSLARGVFSEHPELSELSGITQEETRKQFAKADKQSIRLFRERAAATIDQRSVPSGNQSGPVGTWSESSLIRHEISKQKRHIPIRQLVLRSGRALQALKPCFMMGPLSVAQYLAPGKLKFDLLVMDEASQLKPEDAIGAIARSGQIVIVGDSMQLPPTSFFQRVSLDAEEEDDDDRAVVQEGESILDVVRTLYQPVRRLRWHYRSQHHSLIAFSNQEFYQKDLIVFPSAHHEVPGLGVKYRAVTDGICENSRNPREASVVVEAVLDHMKDFPTETLGVVALNFEQRELIEELLDQRMRADPFAIEYQERMNAGPERFFIKNLENVQGDERDVIFISTTYGPDSRGNQYQRFGPINGANGHRRLNVLFTRAKKRTVVFTSLEPDKIQAGDGSPRGVRVLKQYLTFARTGIVEGAIETGDQPTNDFELSVGAVLIEKGYEVVPQVGVAGFFIDLAVRHPSKLGTFLLGIECDGVGYHSGRSARDRDRLRQEILENLGWKIHRIWSTDWFKNRDTEVKRLLNRVQDVLASDPEYAKEKAKAHKVESLRQRLIDLREGEIKPAFPDSPPERGLLRKTLLDEFVQRRPKTKEDWFRLIHHDLRAGTEPEQVGRYLNRVLEIVEQGD